MDAPVLRTSRLVLRAFAAADIEDLLALFRDPHVRRWLLDDDLVTKEWVESEIAESDARFRSRGCGLWALTEGAHDPIIGFVGFRPFFDPPELQLLYGLLPSHWGRGLATEAALAAIDYAFDVLGFDGVRAATDVAQHSVGRGARAARHARAEAHRGRLPRDGLLRRDRGRMDDAPTSSHQPSLRTARVSSTAIFQILAISSSGRS